MPDVARTETLELQPPARLPATTVRVAQWQSTPASDWTRDDALDAAACIDDVSSSGLARIAAEFDAVAEELSAARAELEASRVELAVVRRDLEVARSRVITEMTEVVRLGVLHARVSAENRALREEKVTVALERLTVTVTGGSTADLTAKLNEQVRGYVDSGEVPDTEVVDIDGLDGLAEDRTPTRHIPAITAAQIMAEYRSRS